MIIGIDFDNTIVSYDVVFHRAAVEQELIPPEVPADKSKIRDYLRWVNKEDAWTELQGLVYGVYIKYAPPFSGVKGFFRYCKENKISICIISHKTRFPFLGKKHNLHKSAVRWFS